MAEMDIKPILYAGFRLGPLLIVFYFLLQSFLQWNLKGIIYLLGLFITYGLGSIISTIIKLNISVPADDIQSINPRCLLVNVGTHGRYYSVLPFSIMIYAYTFFYLLMSLITSIPPKTKLDSIVISYIPMMVLFPLMIILEALWILFNECYSGYQPFAIILFLFASLIVGGGAGVAWAYIVDDMKMPQIKILSAVDNGTVCSRPTKSYFRCKVAA